MTDITHNGVTGTLTHDGTDDLYYIDATTTTHTIVGCGETIEIATASFHHAVNDALAHENDDA